ncbi:MAG: dolichyl-diphosphooligosaccharide--protein glycosyltransferase subunit STT3 [Deltaproteobacteria bacterium]|jgi:dolichyl-diphosphooligosaccharide--protein glycosyltransferase|nr:dolichyl-diphosphooligosaccharide--protein glycosyltransferase subunit STT3 [Deltaproteobacteria bacterium]
MLEMLSASSASDSRRPHWFFFCLRAGVLILLTFGLTFALRMLEWPSWQNPEYRLGQEWLLATHDAYHWVAGAEGFEHGVGHPMSEMLRLLSILAGIPPASLGFWLPPVFAALTAVLMFLWVWAIGGMEAGLCAGVLCSLAPGFLARTLFGYYDTDLITLCFPLLITLIPVCWGTRFLRRPRLVPRTAPDSGMALRFACGPTFFATERYKKNPLSPFWAWALALSGLFAWWGTEWHSVFHYLVRYNTALLALLALVLAPPGQRLHMLLSAVLYGLPALGGLPGLCFVLVFCLPDIGEAMPATLRAWFPSRAFFARPAVIAGLCCLMLPLFFDQNILEMLMGHLTGYIKTAGDLKIDDAGIRLVFPSVAQSIIEVQDLTLTEALFYFHPWGFVSVMGLAGFALVVIRRPCTLFLLPLAALGLLSMKMGGRMVMFGAPVIALGLTLPVTTLVCSLLRSEVRGFWSGFAISLVLLGVLGAPVAELIPAMFNGPILNRRHAEALVRARAVSPEDAILWLWWDWGYAAQHFSRRRVVADGAIHGGPSLYLPAAVFATDNPRFARQLIKYAASKNNEASDVFEGLDNAGAEALMQKLRAPQTPPVQAPGRQFIVVAFEMLRLGFWITNFGSWNFVRQTGIGSAISIIPQQLTYHLENGEVLVEGASSSISASTINVFEDGKFSRRNYIQEWLDKNPNAGEDVRRRYFERRRNIHFFFNRVTDEKLVIDERLYNSLMVQLLISSPGDPALSEHFRLVYDNVFCRVYEVI